MNVPKLRFKEFNDVYNKKILKNIICYIADNRGKNPDYYLENGIPVIDNFMIQNQGYPELAKAKRYIDEILYNNFIRKEIEYNDTLITLVGNGIGNICLTPKEKCVIIQNTLGLRPTKENDKKYLYHLLTFKNSEIKKLDRGMAQPSIRQDELLKLNVTIPSLDEQIKVANFLSLLDKKIELQTKKIEDLKLFKKGLLNIISTQINTTKKLKDICIYQNGSSYEKYITESGNFNLISLNSIDIYGNLKDNMKKIKINNPETLKKNDIVMVLSDVGHGDFLGISALIKNDNKYVLNQRMGLLRIIDSSIPEFVVESINNSQKTFKKLGQGSSQLNLSKEDILNVNIKIPDVKSQIFYSNIFIKMNTILKLNEIKLLKLLEQKKGLMQNMFV